MRTLWDMLTGRTGRNSLITAGGNVTYGILVVAFFALSSRTLGPEQFGLLSITLALFPITFDILSLGTSQALVRFVSVALGKNEETKAHQYASAIFRLRILESLLLIVAAPFLGKLLALRLYGIPELVVPLSLTLASASGILLFDYAANLFQAMERFLLSSSLLVSSAILRLMMITALLLTVGLTVWRATGVFVLSTVVIALVSLVFLKKQWMVSRPSRAVVGEIFSFSKWMALWGVTAFLSGRLDVLLLGKLAGPYETGIYAAASRLAMGYILIGSSFASVLVPKISRLVGKRDEFKRQIILTTKIVGVIIGGMIGLGVAARWFVPFIFGSAYNSSVGIFQGLTVAAIFFMASIPANTTLLSLGFTRWIGSLSVLQLIVMVTLSLRLTPTLGAQGVVAGLTAAYVVTFILSTVYMLKKVFTSA